MPARGQRGFSLVEMLVGLAIFSLAMVSVATLLVQNSRLNKTQQMINEAQANARNTLAIVVQEMRSAGWDPLNSGFAPVVLDPDLSDPVSTIELFADLNEDGDTDDLDEQILIQHDTNRVEWRRIAGGAFTVLAENISNDENGDGVPEPMFVPDSTISPTRITVRITAQSPVKAPGRGDYVRYTVTSDVALRGAL